MMISPEGFIDEYRDKPYKELLPVRDELIEAIREFEADTNHTGEGWNIMPSPEVRYQCNLEYLGKLCELISEKYNREYVWGEDDEDE